MKSAVSWDVAPLGSSENRRFGATYCLQYEGEQNQQTRNNDRGNMVFLRSTRRLLVTANVPISPILVTLMMEALRSSETPVLTKAIRRNIPEDGTLHPIARHLVFVLVNAEGVTMCPAIDTWSH
jgi:hypothetical protein